MNDDALSAAAIRNLTPAQAWEAFVGEQTPVEFVKLGGDTAHYVESAPLCEGLTVAAQSVLRIKLDLRLAREVNLHAARNPVPRMTEAAALALHPDASARNIRAMIACDDDASCPACGARLCWGGRRNTGDKHFDVAPAYCVRGPIAALGLMACDWVGHIHIFDNDTKIAVAI